MYELGVIDEKVKRESAQQLANRKNKRVEKEKETKEMRSSQHKEWKIKRKRKEKNMNVLWGQHEMGKWHLAGDTSFKLEGELTDSTKYKINCKCICNMKKHKCMKKKLKINVV